MKKGKIKGESDNCFKPSKFSDFARVNPSGRLKSRHSNPNSE